VFDAEVPALGILVGIAHIFVRLDRILSSST
jgi:hypothetical protein